MSKFISTALPPASKILNKSLSPSTGLRECLHQASRRTYSTQCLNAPAPRVVQRCSRQDQHAQSSLWQGLPCARQQRACPTIPRSPRYFSTSSPRQYKTIQEARSRYRSGPFSTFSALLFLAAGTGMVFYFRYEKQRVERQRIAEAAKGMGKPKVGGKFELVDHDGKPFSSAEGMGGKFSLVYFGFTHCPDICPEELDKMAQMIDIARAALPPTPSTTPPLLPIFITCDPARDTPAVLKSYLKEFHESIVGLTGTWEQIKAVCKAYRVYFSTPEGVKPGMNYLVDHSIYFYLMDPEGDFVEAIGRQHSAEKAAKIIVEHMGDWKGRVIKKP